MRGVRSGGGRWERWVGEGGYGGWGSIKNAISILEKRNCISVKALLIIHTVSRICPSSVFSTHTFSFSQLDLKVKLVNSEFLLS